MFSAVMEDGGCQKMIMDGYFRALLVIYDSRDVLGKSPANLERNNRSKLEIRTSEPPKQKILRPAISKLRVAISSVFDIEKFRKYLEFPEDIATCDCSFCDMRFLLFFL